LFLPFSRFARPARNPHDAHRPLQGDEDLDRIFSWQEKRKLSRNLTVHFKRMTYLVERSPENIALARKRVVVHEWEDGSVEIHCEGRRLPYSVFDKNPVVSQGAVVECPHRPRWAHFLTVSPGPGATA
jgi:hypothetical protein